jgi:GPH family glycoside/pentoside/hexuronide:cation symporter/oligogalacturonide transporter
MRSEMKRGEKLIFAAGDIYGGGSQAVLSVLYLVFLINIVHISPIWAASVVMISKIWDAVTDPVMGVISDNTRTKIGRRRPYLIFGGCLLVLSLALIWLPVRFESEASRVAYATLAYVFYSTVTTIISVPYSSMSTEITTDIEERNSVNMIRLVFSLSSTAVCTLVPTVIFGRYNSGTMSLSRFYWTLVVGSSLIFALPIVLVGFLTKERVELPAEKSKFSFGLFTEPLKVRSFRRLLALYLSQALTMDIVSSLIIYYAMYVVRGVNSTIFLGTFLAVQIATFPLFNSLVKRVSKITLFRTGLPLAIAGAAGIAAYPSTWPVAGFYALTALMALGFAGAQIMSWIIFPDVVDIGEFGLGRRNSGSFSGFMTFLRKSSSALAIFIVGLVLTLTGFVKPTDAVPHPAQSAEAILGLRFIFGLSFALLLGFAYLVSRGFKLTPEVTRRVRYFIDRRKEVGVEALPADERAEYDALRKEFV